MKRIACISLVALSLCITGCPQPSSPSAGPEGTSQSSGETLTVSAPKALEPSTDEARQALELVSKLVGGTEVALKNKNCELTPSGTVKSIVLDTSALEESNFDLIAAQPDLEKLHIMNFRELNDTMVGKLSGLKKLKDIRLTNCVLTDAGVNTIVESFPELTNLDLSFNTLLTDKSLAAISKLAELKMLVINHCDFREFGIMDISKMPKLETVDIRTNLQIGNSGLGYLAELPSLKNLKHRSTAVDDMGIEALTKAKGLETLEIQDLNITDRAGQLLNEFESLKNLIIFRCEGFTSYGLLELKGMQLNRLTLRGLPSVNDMGMEAFRELTTLRILHLRELGSVTDAGILNLVYLKDLQLLNISEVDITDESLETLVKLTNLKELSLTATGITDAAADLLLSMPNLERLTLKDNVGFSDAGKQKLRDSKKFKKLEISGGK